MRVDGVAALAAVLLVIAVLLWPRRRRSGGATAHDSVWAAPPGAPGGRTDAALPSLWHRDPVELFRRWRLRRRSGELADDALELLRGVGPALDAGLTPSRSIELAAAAALGAERVALARQRMGRSRRGDARHRRPGWGPATRPGAAGHDIDQLVGALLAAAEKAEVMSPVWAHWAARSRSAELALVAAAWQLSETTGAPLSFAVDRAVRGLLDARARRRKVAVAVAGPRATVTVLTTLPLTGPLFGLAVGVDPRVLYLGTPLASVCVAAGLALVWAGRVWCTRMVRRAVRP
ncbi:type II secretion system F family protein [Terrabacter terrigena]|uniref:Type II secretion system F family protein n=1 Tax=Terrabacter terrigena TaxID=574718 RepID=A0ABW3MWF9_9MICO